MKANYTSIFLLGPWLSGKTTLGQRIAKVLGWNFLDMDFSIVAETGKTIDQLTQHGTDWQVFRNSELELLQTLLQKEHLVIGCGGGVGVNDIVKHETNVTFGALELELFQKAPDAYRVVLLPNKNTFITRVKHAEEDKLDTFRPLLDEQHAKELQDKMSEFANDPQKQREMYIEGKVNSAVRLYERRHDLYKKLGHLTVDTGKLSVDEAAQLILDNFTMHNKQMN